MSIVEPSTRDATLERKLRLLAKAVALLVLAVICARAWIADDALITVRTIDNLLHGHGLRWNVSERVQAFTHPLWALLLIPPMALGAGWYASLLGLGMVATVAFGVGLLRSRAPGNVQLLAVSALAFSGAFLDFSSSGLENPLTHLLLLLLVALLPAGSASLARLRIIALLGALLALTRMDTVLLVLPCLLYTMMKVRERGVAGFAIGAAVLVGFSPLLVWEAFSIAYYGFPVPNTAYAKLNTGIERATLLSMGTAYYRFTATHDPWTLIATAALALLAARFRTTRAAVAGLIGTFLYSLYTWWIGGDFMGGRFLTAPLVLLAALVVSQHVVLPNRVSRAALGLTILGGSLAAFTPSEPGRRGRSGPVNERTQSAKNSLLQVLRNDGKIALSGLTLGSSWREAAEAYGPAASPPRYVRHAHTIGAIGLAAGPGVHIIDHLALSDALLARLPAGFDPDPQPGHFERMGQWSSAISVIDACPLEYEVCRFWKEYEHSIKAGACTLDDANLCVYWGSLRLVTEGPLFSKQRWLAILRLNLGLLDYRIDRGRYQQAVLEYPGKLR
jgi:arabinofuranosyltransferase